MPAANSLDDVMRRIAGQREALYRDFGLRRIGVFGSYARGEQGPDSDIDLLVEFESPIGLFKFQRLESTLQALLGHPVDLVTPGALKPLIGARIREQLRDV